MLFKSTTVTQTPIQQQYHTTGFNSYQIIPKQTGQRKADEKDKQADQHINLNQSTGNRLNNKRLNKSAA